VRARRAASLLVGVVVVLTTACAGSSRPQASGTTPAADGGNPAPPLSGDAGTRAVADAGSSSLDSDGAPSSGTDSGGGIGLASKYPGDVGIDGDPAVVWGENFEEGSVSAFTARYDESKNPAGMSLVPDVPPASAGTVSLQLVASGDGANATDFYKSFNPGYDEWYVRWYAKYQSSIVWHHTGTWFGGYNPATSYPNPQAGLQPVGNDRFSVSIEPIYGIGTATARFDTYNYWMQMHSWMDQPTGDTAYYGNSLVHQNAFTIDEETWSCVEVHVKLNTDLTSATGAILEVWKNDTLVQHFDETTPLGYWIKDKFCPSGADGSECTDYPAPDNTVLNLQWRSTAQLQLNYFWPQNYITQSGVTGSVNFDDMVVATERVGCIQ
jgi:hypothetical protein